MSNIFKEKIGEIYNVILQPIDIMYKLTAINNCKTALNIGRLESFGEHYFNLVQDKKLKGIVYTPIQIADYIVKNTILKEDIIENPFIKIADPACGSGNLIIPCFLYLKKLYNENLKEINEKNSIYLSNQDIDRHIIENNLFGFDIDEFALKILSIDLFSYSHYIKKDNFRKRDFLFETNEEKFDVFIGNPPYIGQKNIDKDYSNNIKKLYKELYKDKGDLSYCFFGAALNKLKLGGKLTFITSRYFLESPSGEILRKTLKEFCDINRIIDFYGIRPFKNIGIDPVIIFLELGYKEAEIDVIKPVVCKEKEFLKGLYENINSSINCFKINKSVLNDKGWILRDEKERTIINKIEEKCFTNLANICFSYQGIITGCDKAFVVDEAAISSEKLELDIIKPWIKSSFVEKGRVKRENKFIIYSDAIQDERDYPNSIMHINPYKERLMERRECKSGVRNWYELQWGRVQSIFEGEKLVFPFKSNKSRFAIDKGSFFSADVYCLVLKEAVPFTYDYLLKILNSKVYEYYFKTFAKKLGEDQYEYYPNNLMKLCIPTMINISSDTDSFLYDFFQLDEQEKAIVEQYIS
ncbi:N-6 DNA methylase [Clostridium swellfunianum]|uniref:Eco57I restriction-modification methylase domain-containing protein n=1 Tax=Clostridium swellfunianum TaxID=1367462 RepID=UPI00202F87CC|nr:N-6 DNA methylase [Clostridium swellfunianum]MCM0650569.1 N-6 DNA methylase [Clostridium swellfunianum]